MRKDKELKVRVSQEIYVYVENLCNINGISKAEVVRQAILSEKNSLNEKDLAQKICAMQSILT